MTTPNFYKSDQDMQTLIHATEEHIQSMRQAGQMAESIRATIMQNYQADSATTFLNRLDDWLQNYNLVMGKFQALQDSSTAVNNLINQATQDAQSEGLSWGSQVFSQLNP